MFFREDFSGKHFGEINFLKTVPKNRCFQGKIFFGATPLKIGDRGVLSPGFYHKTGNMRFAREWPFLPFTELYRFFFKSGENIHENFFPGKHSVKRPFPFFHPIHGLGEPLVGWFCIPDSGSSDSRVFAKFSSARHIERRKNKEEKRYSKI